MMVKPLLEQLKARRLALGLKQKDMMLRIGVSRQQYQHIESKGNPRLNTLELLAKGLNSELLLIPAEKLSRVNEILNDGNVLPASVLNNAPGQSEENELANDPWRGLLEDTK